MQNKYLKFILVALVVAFVVPQIALATWWNPTTWHFGWLNMVFHFQQTEQKQNKDNPVACTMEAKQCPDGSYVSRQGPKCEFKPCPGERCKKDTDCPTIYCIKAPCPQNKCVNGACKLTEADQTAGWKTYTSNELKYSFKYPAGWRVIPNSVYSAAGFGGLVGYTITTSNSKTPLDNERIDIGGAQIDCQHLVSQDGLKHSPEGLCKTNYPVYTFSTDPKIISVFNTIVNSISDTNQPVVGGDKDAHGCIGSAGYTWCEEKQKCLRSWEEKCEAVNIKVSDIPQGFSKAKDSSRLKGYWKDKSLLVTTYDSIEKQFAGAYLCYDFHNFDDAKIYVIKPDGKKELINSMNSSPLSYLKLKEYMNVNSPGIEPGDYVLSFVGVGYTFQTSFKSVVIGSETRFTDTRERIFEIEPSDYCANNLK